MKKNIKYKCVICDENLIIEDGELSNGGLFNMQFSQVPICTSCSSKIVLQEINYSLYNKKQ